MNLGVNISLKLTDEQMLATLETMRLQTSVYNDVAKYAAANRIKNAMKLHYDLYNALRAKYPSLPSALLARCFKDVAGAIKTIGKQKKNKKAKTPSREQNALSLSVKSLTVRGDQITYSTIGKRVKAIAPLPSWFKKRYPDAKPKNAGTITYDKERGFVLCLVCETPTPALRTEGEVIGIDRGIYNPVATSTGERLSGKEIRAYCRETLYNVRHLQQKGTASARRKLKRVHRKRQRFMRDVNHCISKKLASDPKVRVYALENLKGVSRGKKHKQSRKLNNWLGSWAFYQFQTFLEYKCAAQGIEVAYVNPAYTSQTCSCCGAIHKEARNGSRFQCKECGFRCHADINASKNIAAKYLSAQSR